MKTSIAERELAAAQRRAGRAWSDLEKRRANKLQEVTEIERQLEALHPLMHATIGAAMCAHNNEETA